ncbi:MAG: hypothetical protein ACRDHF_14375 [Tepidiformaceae bacterium]
MPTHFEVERFMRDWNALTPNQRARFHRVLVGFREDVGSGTFRRSLRVKGVQGRPGVFEMSWARNGRAHWMYGPEVHPGLPHIIWLRIGTHEIFDRP